VDEKKYLRKPQLDRLLAHLRKQKNRPRRYFMVRISAAMGLRMTEARHMLPADLRRLAGEGLIAVRVAKRHDQQSKGLAGREIVWQRVSKKLQTELLVFLRWARIDPNKDTGWIFPGRDPTKPAHKQSIHDWFTQACIDCGIGRKTFHCLRHYRGFTVQSAKHDLAITQRALRHKDAKTTVIYTQPTPDEERELENEIDA